MLKSIKTTGVKRRWMFNHVALVIALVIVLVCAFSGFYAAFSYAELRDNLKEKATTAAEFFKAYEDRSYDDYYQSCVRYAQNYNDGQVDVHFLSAAGQVEGSSDDHAVGETLKTADVTKAISDKLLSVFCGKDPDTGERVAAVCAPLVYTDGTLVGILRFASSTHNVDVQVVMTICIAVLVGLFLIAFVLCCSRFFVRFIFEPVTEITATAKRIAAGSYGATVQKRGEDEIGELADTINEISAKISQTEKMQSEFISSVSHELRTPLTAITGWGETLLAADSIDPEETRRGMAIILREARRLTGMVEELLEFTRMQDGRFTLNMEMTDILSEFEDTFFMYGSRLRQEGIELEYLESDEEIPEILCDAARLRQVFLNILDNAAKHGGEGKKITASIGKTENRVLVRIRDYGPGIPEDELPHIKLKFYKGSSKARGNGIGLAVCEEIVAMHGGELLLENAEDCGALVTIFLPIGEN